MSLDSNGLVPHAESDLGKAVEKVCVYSVYCLDWVGFCFCPVQILYGCPPHFDKFGVLNVIEYSGEEPTFWCDCFFEMEYAGI